MLRSQHSFEGASMQDFLSLELAIMQCCKIPPETSEGKQQCSAAQHTAVPVLHAHVLKWHAQSSSAMSELGRSASPAPFAQEEAKAEAEDDTAWDEETIASDEEGLVIFDGGTYSRGPAALVELGGAADAGNDEDLEADKERLERQLTLEVCTKLFSALGGRWRDSVPLLPFR